MTCLRLTNGYTLHQWCRKNSIKYKTVWGYIERGFAPEVAIEKAKDRVGIAKPYIKRTYNGKSIVELCGGSDTKKYSRIMSAFHRGLSFEEAFEKEKKKYK